MDIQTQQFYADNSARYAESLTKNSLSDGIDQYFSTAFIAKSKVLDIGCGTGRDLRILQEMGLDAFGVDPCEEFVFLINKNLRDSAAYADNLPSLAKIADKSYDGILCSAVLMHLPEEELFDASFAIRRVLKEHGRLLLSIPLHDETIDQETKRDSDGRLFNGIVPEELQLIFERIGFRLLNRWESDDSLNREHRKWATMLFELESATGFCPIDTIESILNKDAKVATYKLALFRSFANIATTNYKLAQWTNDGRVKISTQALAEKWIEYYWPLIEADIKQTTGKAIAFRKQLKKLVDYFQSRGGLSAFVLQYRNNKLSIEARKICKTVMSKLKGTIWNQPVRYAGGGGDFSVFQYDKSDQTVLIGSEIWKELSLMGTWIQDATILRWAELSAKIAKNEIKPSAVIDCLLTVPIHEREVNAAKSFYDALKGKECVWTGKNIPQKYNLDHAIPFSLWKNNDLWNLLPADAKVNGNKKDKLPDNSLIKFRKDCIVHYWTLINEEFPARFEYEAAKLIGCQKFDKTNWENRLFATFAEAVEITAIQRGVDRWEPAFKNISVNLRPFSVERDVSDNQVTNMLEEERAEDAIREDSHKFVAKTELNLFNYNQISGKAFVEYLPFAGDVAAGIPMHDLEDLYQFSEETFKNNQIPNEIGSTDLEWIECPKMYIKQRRFIIRISGDSMEPKCSIGDYVICEYHRHFQPDHKVVIMANFVDLPETGECAIKRISETEDFWIFSSDNIKYDDIKVTKEDVNPEYPIYGTVIYNLTKQKKIH